MISRNDISPFIGLSANHVITNMAYAIPLSKGSDYNCL